MCIRDSAQHQVAVETSREHHTIDPSLRRDHDGQAVGARHFVQRFERRRFIDSSVARARAHVALSKAATILGRTSRAMFAIASRPVPATG